MTTEKIILAVIVLGASLYLLKIFFKCFKGGKCPSCKNCSFDPSRDQKSCCGGTESDSAQKTCGCGCSCGSKKD